MNGKGGKAIYFILYTYLIVYALQDFSVNSVLLVAIGLSGYYILFRGGESREVAYTKNVWLFIGALFFIAAAVFINNSVWLYPDTIFLIFLAVALLFGNRWSFVKEWTPLVALIFAFHAMRSIIYRILPSVHYMEPYNLETWLFRGALPTIWLQEHFYTPYEFMWYDTVAVVVYGMHFLAPLAFAFILWHAKFKRFIEFRDTYLILTYITLITYLAYPMAPPWMLFQKAFIFTPIHKIVVEYDILYYGRVLNSAHKMLEANPVAAMPSLHAAYPMLILIHVWRHYRRWTPPALAFTLAMGLSLVYLGEHYVIDVIAGWIYAIACCAVYYRYLAQPAAR